MNTELRRIVGTIALEDVPHIEVLAVRALLRLVEWLHHEGITSARTTLEITAHRPPSPCRNRAIASAHPDPLLTQRVAAVLIERVGQHQA